MRTGLTEEDIDKWLSWSFGHLGEEGAKNSCNSSEEGTINSLKKDNSKQSNKLGPDIYRSKQGEILKNIIDKEYKLIDILLSTQHEKSDSSEVDFLLSMKAKETG
jgi:hypothetical protein